MDIRQHWKEVGQQAEHLGREVYLVTIPRVDLQQPGGCVVIARNQLAAKLIVQGTHQVATEEQIEAYQAAEAKERERINQVATVERSSQVVVMSPEMAATIGNVRPSKK